VVEIVGRPLEPTTAQLADLVPATESAGVAETLESLEAIVRKGLDGVLEMAWALRRIRDGRLYQPAYRTFAAYLKTEWPEIGRRTAYDRIRATEVAERVRTSAQIGSVEHLLLLSRLPEDEQARHAPSVASLGIREARVYVGTLRAAHVGEGSDAPAYTNDDAGAEPFGDPPDGVVEFFANLSRTNSGAQRLTHALRGQGGAATERAWLKKFMQELGQTRDALSLLVELVRNPPPARANGPSK